MIEIDGSQGEGGGQIIRTALSLSAITGKPVCIFNIRAGRPNPGLQAQHLTAAKAVRSICRGTLEHAELKSNELIFNPGEIVGGKYEFNIGTAGSVTLVAQTLIPILNFASKNSIVRIIGGTHVIKSPGYDYFEKLFIPAIGKMGMRTKSKINKTGYYPRGGGEIEFEVEPSEIRGQEEWAVEENTEVLIRLSRLPMSIAIREKKIFVKNGTENIRVFEDDAQDPGNAILVWKGFKGVYTLGEKGKRAEDVAEQALEELKKEYGEEEKSDVDRHLADQLLIYAALAEGKTSYKTSDITMHLITNMDIIRKFLERRIEVNGKTITVGVQ